MKKREKKKWIKPKIKGEKKKGNQTMDCDQTGDEGCGWAGRFR
jgi:hypothetical protein